MTASSRSVATVVVFGGLFGTALAQQSPTKKFEVEVVYLTRHGCQPQRIQRPQGHFMLRVEDFSHGRGKALTVQRGDGTVAIDVKQVVSTQKGWSVPVDLAPGQYFVVAQGDPRYRCEIDLR